MATSPIRPQDHDYDDIGGCGGRFFPEIPKYITSAFFNGALFTVYYYASPSLAKLGGDVLKTQMISFVASSALQAGVHYYEVDETSLASRWLGTFLPFIISSYAAPFLHTPAKVNLLTSSLLMGGSQTALNELTNYLYSSSEK